jgi:hypothetical protein
MDKLKPGKYEVKITPYRDGLDDGRIQIVVQSYFQVRLGMGLILVDGFTISRDNGVHDMEAESLYEFI